MRYRTLVLAALVAAFAPALGAEDPTPLDLGELYRALAVPQVIGHRPSTGPLRVGRAEIVPAAGTRWLALSALGEVCGYVLDGAATVRYRVEDPFSIPIARRNLEGVRSLATRDAGGALLVEARADGVAVWGWQLDVGGELEPASGAPLPGWLRELLAAKLSDNPERDLLVSRFGDAASYRWVAFHAGSDDFQLDVDGRPFAREEMLLASEKLPSGSGDLSGRVGSRELAAQPIGRSWLEGNPLELVSVDTAITLRADAGDRLDVSTRTRLRVLRDDIRLLTLGLWDRIWDDRLREHEYRVSRVAVGGKPANYFHHGGALFVELAAPAARGAELELEVDVAGDILVRPAGDSYWRLLGDWYPNPTLGGAELAEIRLSMNVPSPWLPFAPGEVLERGAGGGFDRVRTRLHGPMERAAVLAGKYSSVTVEQGKERVHVSTYASVKKDEAERLAQIVLAVRGCLERWLGVPYPFQDLQVIEVNDWGWGQAPAGVVFITKEAFMTPARAKLEEEEQALAGAMTRNVNERVAHEVAHAWFPHVAKVVRSEENWLSESLADYTSAYCLSEAMGEKKGKYHWNRQVDQWQYWSKEAGADASVFLAEHLAGGETDARTRHYLLYGRGPLVLHSIRQQLEKKHGKKEADRIFLTWIRSYVKTFEFKVAETRHLIGILEQITGEAWMPFFERYLLGTERPAVD
ncbi:MAG: hypothetical protein H6511_08920 [Holophagales bacterium]|nr:hypothetical protein [Holophagales bacterium]